MLFCIKHTGQTIHCCSCILDVLVLDFSDTGNDTGNHFVDLSVMLTARQSIYI